MKKVYDEDFIENVWKPFVPAQYKNDLVRANRIKLLFRYNQCLIKYNRADCLRGDDRFRRPELSHS
jgi:hypothetical protein